MSDEFESDEKQPRRRRPVEDDADDDDRDDDRPRKRQPSAGGDAVSAVIPYKNVPALISYYAGVFGLLTCFIFGVGGLFGILPIGLGVFGLVTASKNKDAHGRLHAWIGIGLGVFEALVGCGFSVWFLFAIISESGRR
jgi:hypothetical protein